MIYKSLIKSAEQNKKQFAVLVDPDKYDEHSLLDLASVSKSCGVNYFLVGGSLMMTEKFELTIQVLKSASDIPVIIFPGSNLQISNRADAILLLSLISGRNPEHLIGQHVVAAPYLKDSGLEILSTGYILIEGDNSTTANYMSNSLPIPYDKSEIAVATAMAGEMLGMKMIYMDGGSGANKTISKEMISGVKQNIDVPLIVGGGIRSAEDALIIWSAGADMIVVGNAIENNPDLIESITRLQKSTIGN